MKQGLLLSLLLLGPAVQAEQDKVYLLATAGLSASTMAQTVFLHEPDITDLAGCQEALRQGQRDGDWLKYHHILRKDKMKGFTVQMQYRCVTSAQEIEPWYERSRYDHAYLVGVDEASRLNVQPMDTMAACMGVYRSLSAEQQASKHCTKGNQRVR
ncbi:hypothetical protein [Pseudomonas sp. Gutcm_11s]|uniref:hypothetical protein n=1 Tax=Pseudomonas sp. Gutcm_11s TaxID=3026088 RepID=UPI00235F8208|nr:hypothetical protein [Pseudomonas sp. Gutcm_11s]MDD0844767.1 hypothetical protein [Pseudomonas sp. Gutcm_11s]